MFRKRVLPRILLTGGSGSLGSEILKLNPNILAPKRVTLDLTDPESISYIINNVRPDIVIHCGAYTNVSMAKKNKRVCWDTNVSGTVNLLKNCSKLKNVRFVYVSTACVFSGEEGNYSEYDIPCPVNFYGLTKTIAENLVMGSSLDWLVVRTNFVKRGKWSYPKAFSDRFGTYLYADQVAKRLLNLVFLHVKGLVHVCGDKRMSMLELAKQYSPSVKPLTLKEYYEENPDAEHLTEDMTLKSNYNY